MTIDTIKATMETMLPENWEYAHDHYVDEAIADGDIEGMIADGYSEKEIAQEIIDDTIRCEEREFRWACQNIWDAQGVDFDEDEYGQDTVKIDDELYTAEHQRKLAEIALEAARDAAEYEKELDAMRVASYNW